jgi:hypothetical protein
VGPCGGDRDAIDRHLSPTSLGAHHAAASDAAPFAPCSALGVFAIPIISLQTSSIFAMCSCLIAEVLKVSLARTDSLGIAMRDATRLRIGIQFPHDRIRTRILLIGVGIQSSMQSATGFLTTIEAIRIRRKEIML